MRNKESLIVMASGLAIMAALNLLMLQYHYDVWTNPKVGFWSAFYNRFELSGFDPFTYITVSKWRPLYVLERHPLLAAMMWPLAELNSWMKSEWNINCAIFIIAAVWTVLGTLSWTLMYRILRRITMLCATKSLLLTTWFFSFSHIMLVTFTPDHMSITLPLLLLTVYLAGKAIMERRTMPLWQSLPLLFLSTGVTTTNMVKVGLADLFTQWGRRSLPRIIRHFAVYLLPLALILGLYVYQTRTTQAEETRSNNELMRKKADKDKTFARRWEHDKAELKRNRQQQLIHFNFVTNTEHHVDRWPSVVENIFGEGFILHERHTLEDANRKRPPLVRYGHWWFYGCECVLLALFAAGVWCGRRSRLVWMTMSMFLFDMLLHVGLNFANADVYIMTAHWAFAIPIAVAYLLKAVERRPRLNMAVLCAILFLTVFLWAHNLKLTVEHIIHI